MGGACSCDPEDDTQVVANGQKTKKDSDIIHFFMLGIEGAGKTTIIRQLKCLCIQKPGSYQMYDDNWKLVPAAKIYNSNELDDLKKVVRINLIIALASLAEKTRIRGKTITKADVAQKVMELAERILHSGTDIYDYNNQVESVYGQYIVDLLSDPAIAATMAAHNNIAGLKIEDGTLYFLLEPARILNAFDDDYQLTAEEIVNVRKPTVTFKSYKFRIKELRVEIHDMGGQKTELVKVPEFMKQFLSSDGQCFLLYVSSMSGFHEPDKDAKEKTVLDKSIKILETVLTLDGVDECSLMIFLNKQDRFEDIAREKLKTAEGEQEIKKYLGNYIKENKKTKSDNLEHLKDAIANRFKEAIKPQRSGKGGKGYYMKYTQATDAQLMSSIFYAVEREIVSNYLTRGNFLH